MVQEKKQQNNQLFALQKLESSEDPNAVLLFLDVEKQIVADESLLDYFEYPGFQNTQLLNDQLRRTYLSGYLAKYDFNAYILNTDSSKNSAIALERLSYFKDKVISGSRKVSANFRSEEHTSELQSLMRISYAVFCLKKKKK